MICPIIGATLCYILFLFVIACVRTHFWHLAGMSLDILGLGETHSGGPQDMDQEEGDMLCLKWSSHQAAGHHVPGSGMQGTGIDPALVI